MTNKYTTHHAEVLEPTEAICDYCHTYWDSPEAPCHISINVAHMNGHCPESPDGKHEFGIGGYGEVRNLDGDIIGDDDE